MSTEDHHRDALLETARLELDRAHRAALAMQAGDVRRGLQGAHAALTEHGAFAAVAGRVAAALAKLDEGKLAEMEQIIETARTDLLV